MGAYDIPTQTLAQPFLISMFFFFLCSVLMHYRYPRRIKLQMVESCRETFQSDAKTMHNSGPHCIHIQANVVALVFFSRSPGLVQMSWVHIRCQDSPCLTNVWLVSRRMSQPSTIMRSMARFLRMFSVSLTSSCIILWRGTNGDITRYEQQVCHFYFIFQSCLIGRHTHTHTQLQYNNSLRIIHHMQAICIISTNIC